MSTAKTSSGDLPTGLTVDEYLAWADTQEGRFELLCGEVFATSPQRARHAKTKFALQLALVRAIEAAGLPCHMLPDGMTVRAREDTAFEPDSLVYCGDEVDPDSVEIAEPIIVVEVVSPSTRKIDTSRKLDGYFSVASVHHYLIVDPVRRRIVHHQRQSGVRILTSLYASGSIRLDPPGLELDVERCFA
jgi:Uma2 family endonuclease